MSNKLELRICLIHAANEKGVYIKNGKIEDSIVVPLYDLGFLFFKVLYQHIELLLTRNGILPED